MAVLYEVHLVKLVWRLVNQGSIACSMVVWLHKEGSEKEESICTFKAPLATHPATLHRRQAGSKEVCSKEYLALKKLSRGRSVVMCHCYIFVVVVMGLEG